MKYLLGIIVAAIAVVGIFFVASWFSYSNMGATMEQNVKMTYEDNKVVLNSYTAKVSEAAQVPDMYRDDLQKVIESTFQGRYGENGSQAVFQFINENNMTLEPQLYIKIQQIIESGREDFKVSQKRLVDVTNNYELALQDINLALEFEREKYAIILHESIVYLLCDKMKNTYL